MITLMMKSCKTTIAARPATAHVSLFTNDSITLCLKQNKKYLFSPKTITQRMKIVYVNS